MISIASVMFPYECPVFHIWFEYPDLLLFFMSLICSLYLMLSGRPVCPVYFIGQLMHLIWYTPIFSYLSVYVYGFNMFCMIFFRFECNFYICIFKELC
jgi:hypothetical protein